MSVAVALFYIGAIMLGFGVLAGIAEYLDGKESGR